MSSFSFELVIERNRNRKKIRTKQLGERGRKKKREKVIVCLSGCAFVCICVNMIVCVSEYTCVFYKMCLSVSIFFISILICKFVCM